MNAPARHARRWVMAGVVVGATVLAWVFLPLWFLGAAVVSHLLPGRFRAVRVLWLAIVYATLETLLLGVLLGLWFASGLGRRLRSPYFEGIHYELVQGAMAVLFAEGRRVLRLTIATEGPTPDAHPGDPILVACRHAGPGDSFTLVHTLMSWYAREPRVVLKDTLRWDPLIDVLLGRVPARFISTAHRDGLEEQIHQLASGLDENDAFVIFPEGGNFTPQRRTRAIDKLHARGLGRFARRAEAMRHVLAPQPGGLFTALDAAPGADVVLVAHTGLDHLEGAGDVWRALPMEQQILMRWWRVPRSEVPADHDGRIEWLYGWWEHIDAWVEEHRTAA